MAKYNYNKHATITTPQYNQPGWTATANTTQQFSFVYRTATWNSATGRYALSNQFSSSETIGVGTVGYGMWDSTLAVRLTCINQGSSNNGILTKQEIQNNPSVTNHYSAGALQSTIQAEDGTYPVNGRHSDGFFYVRGAIVATAPTTPDVFTQPTGKLETGDAKVISWGASTDAENNLSKYVLEASLNGGAFAVIAQTTTPTFSYTVPTATSVKFRVKAVDTGGLESAYRESALFTVSKPMYYWSKHNAVATPI